MKQEAIELLPDWWQTEKGTSKSLILSNDLDSLLSCTLLNKYYGWDINLFYDFHTGMYWNGEGSKKKSQTVGVDLALDYGNIKCFDNHVTSDTRRYLNPNLINLNNAYGINSTNYFRKFPFSTSLLLYSLLGIDLPKTDTGKAILLKIDSGEKSFYNAKAKNNSEWEAIHKHWLVDILEFPELYELEQEHTQEDFDMFSFINEAKIEAVDDWNDNTYSLYFDLKHKRDIEKELEINLNLPTQDFKLIVPCKSKGMWLDGISKGTLLDRYKIVNFVMTGKNHCNFSYRV